MKQLIKLTLLLGASISSTSFGQVPCKFPQAPQNFLELVSKDRAISAKVGEPEYTKMFNFLTRKNDIPNPLSSCRMTPVEITGVDPLENRPRKVNAWSFALKSAPVTKLKTVVLMPPTGGRNPLDDAYAVHLCETGMRVLLVEHWEGDSLVDLDMGMHDRGAMLATAAVEDVVEFINPEKPEQLGILGTSVGAITSSLVLGVDARISSGVIIVGGGGMPKVIGESTEATLSKLRDARMAALHLKSKEEYVEALSKQVLIEPLNFVNFAKQKKVLFYLATQDVTVPTSNQYDLYKALGSQELITHDADHIHTILHTSWKEKDHIAAFFQKNLEEASSEDLTARGGDRTYNKLCRNAR